MITKDSVCFKCGLKEGTLNQPMRFTYKGEACINRNAIVKLIHHHVKYGEQEKIVLCCKSCHRQIHNRLRREGKCKISAKDIDRLSTASKDSSRKRIYFSETIENHISFREQLTVMRGGNILYSAFFLLDSKFNNLGKIKYIDEVRKK